MQLQKSISKPPTAENKSRLRINSSENINGQIQMDFVGFFIDVQDESYMHVNINSRRKMPT